MSAMKLVSRNIVRETMATAPTCEVVECVDQLKSAVAQLKAGDAAVLRIQGRRQFQFLAFQME